jgi:hypothetical protein
MSVRTGRALDVVRVERTQRETGLTQECPRRSSSSHRASPPCPIVYRDGCLSIAFVRKRRSSGDGLVSAKAQEEMEEGKKANAPEAILKIP